MRHVIDTVVGSLRRLIRQCNGNVAMVFGLCAIPAVIAAGMAIDVGRAYMVKIRLGAALDAAALAVGSETNQTQTQLQTDLQNYFTANYPSSALGTNVTVTPVPANVDLTSAVINWQAQATVPMTVMQLVGVKQHHGDGLGSDQEDRRPGSGDGARQHRIDVVRRQRQF
jgi:Flp pilus assembly protein TadG